MKKHLFLIVIFCSIQLFSQKNTPSFDSIYKRPIPTWFNQAKFGIFIVWGPYSVPSYVPKGYAEWYWKRSQTEKEVKDFHNKFYGENFKYEQFADLFKAELWNPELWCQLFKDSGAKYVVTTANYHDGYAMYPTKYSETIGRKDWNSMVTGPKRDLIGELNSAGEKLGLKMGIYYSLTEWYHPWWKDNNAKFVKDWLHPKFKEVVNRYKPWHIFLDGDWMPYKKWKSEELAHWLYTESNVKDYVVVNDRWGTPARGSFGDVYESEFGGGKYTSPNHPWQEDRGIGTSYSYNRMENIYDYDSKKELIKTLSNVIGGGGNFLLSIGPTGDGRIPVIMQERMLQIGEWLKINGEAVYGTTASPFWPRTFDWGTISKKESKLFFHIHNPDLGKIEIEGISAKIKSINLLTKNTKVPVSYKNNKNTLTLQWPSYLNNDAVTIIEMNVKNGYTVDKTQHQYSNGTVEFNCRAMTLKGNKAYPYYHGIRNRLWMANWTDPKESLSIKINIHKAGTYKLEAFYVSSKKKTRREEIPTVGGKFMVVFDDYKITSTITATKSTSNPEPKYLETIKIKKPGIYNLKVIPVDDGNWKGFRFQGIKLTPVK